MREIAASRAAARTQRHRKPQEEEKTRTRRVHHELSIEMELLSFIRYAAKNRASTDLNRARITHQPGYSMSSNLVYVCNLCAIYACAKPGYYSTETANVCGYVCNQPFRPTHPITRYRVGQRAKVAPDRPHVKINKKAVISQRLPHDAPDRTIRQYAHVLLLESPFVPSSTDCWTIRAKIRQKRPSWWP